MRFVVLMLALAAGLSCPIASAQKLERGMLLDGKPAGVWEYYDGKELGLIINYDSSKVRYLRPDTSRYSIWLDSAWQQKRLSRAPRLLGSKTMVVTALQQKLRYPFADLRQGNEGHVIVSCVVQENGQVSAPVVVQTPSPGLGEEVRRIVVDLPLAYLPALYRGLPVQAQVAFVVTFCRIQGAVPACPDGPKVLGEFNHVTVTAMGPPLPRRP